MKIVYKLSMALLLILTIGIAKGLAQNVDQWDLDKAHTSVNFEVKHFFNTVNGNFKDFNGTFLFDPNNLEESKFTFTVPISSIETNNDKRNNHLKSADFFDTEKFPTIKFVSSGFEKKSDKNYVVNGNLMIKEVSKSVSIPFEITGIVEHPMKEGIIIMGLSFSTQINRNDYNVGAGDWTSNKIVGENVKISVNTELNK